MDKNANIRWYADEYNPIIGIANKPACQRVCCHDGDRSTYGNIFIEMPEYPDSEEQYMTN